MDLLSLELSFYDDDVAATSIDMELAAPTLERGSILCVSQTFFFNY